MRSKAGFAAVWIVTTAAGVAISWAGVGDAVRSTASTTPELSAGIPVHQGRQPAMSPASTPPPEKPQVTAVPSTRRPSHSPTPKQTPTSGAPTAGAPTSKAPSGKASPGEEIRTYTVRHGRVTLAIGPDSARLVSTSPDSGYTAKVWRRSTWLRVDLTNGPHGSAVFVTWHSHAPLVEFHEY
ncbi:hypothetical protein ACQEU3_16385 [Spirillospora sp. CA-253888]